MSIKTSSEIGKSNVKTSRSHERRVAKLLTDWSGIKFRRRRVEGRDDAVRVVESVADVIPCEGQFNYTVECKKGRGFSFNSLMINPTKCLFTNWWHQCAFDARLVSEDFNRTIYPMMFFKPLPNWDWLAFSAKSIHLLNPKINYPRWPNATIGGLWFPCLRFDHYGMSGPIEGNVSHSKKNKKIVAIDLDPVVICSWADFAENVDPKSTFHCQKAIKEQ